MPELRECVAFWLIASEFFTRALAASLCLRILRLWADAADSNVSETRLTTNGLPYVLENTSTVKRGSWGRQSPLYPPQLRPTKSRPNPPKLETYELFEIDKTMRTLILGFRQREEDGGRTLYAKVCIGALSI